MFSQQKREGAERILEEVWSSASIMVLLSRAGLKRMTSSNAAALRTQNDCCMTSKHRESYREQTAPTDLYIHLFLAVKMGAAICKFYGSCFRSHPRPAIFSCTKQFVLLLDNENWCVLPYYFNVLYYLWTLWFVVQTVLPFTARCYSPRYLPIAVN